MEKVLITGDWNKDQKNKIEILEAEKHIYKIVQIKKISSLKREPQAPNGVTCARPTKLGVLLLLF